MTNLTGLKLSAIQKPISISAVQQRRNKLVRRLWEQGELAKAQQAGTQFAPKKFRTVTDIHGERRQVVIALLRTKTYNIILTFSTLASDLKLLTML